MIPATTPAPTSPETAGKTAGMLPSPAALSRQEILQYLEGGDDPGLFALAREMRARVFGLDVYLRGIVEFSNHCRMTCHYCGLRAANEKLQRYRLTPQEILQAASRAPELGLGTVVLQSGEDLYYDAQKVGGIVSQIKQRLGLAVTLSLGERPFEELAFWRRCGADRYLLKFETGNAGLHARLRPGRTMERRLACLRDLQELGYEAGSGVIVGLPGQGLDDLADAILLLQGLDLDMLSAGPFLPHPDTPLGREPAGSVALSLRVMALLRLLAPGCNIPATSALEVARPEGRLLGLQAGANVIMPTITPQHVRAGYAIYPGKNAPDDDVQELVSVIKKTIRQAGLRPSADLGPAPRRRAVTQGADNV